MRALLRCEAIAVIAIEKVLNRILPSASNATPTNRTGTFA
jgi:hypothetical protein